MKAFTSVIAALVIVLPGLELRASGPIGIYAVVEKVVFEPSEQAPQRIQLWGAFSFADGGILPGAQTSTPQRGYLYFTMPASATEAQARAIRAEWADLKKIAGTGEAVAFGGGNSDFRSTGAFSPDGPNNVYSSGVNFRVLKSLTPGATPAPYPINAGMVRLPAEGSHAAVVRQLRDAIKGN